MMCRLAALCGLGVFLAVVSVAPASALSEGRQWELVSPPNKLDAAIFPTEAYGGITQASESGSSLTYITSNAPVADAEGNRAYEVSQILARRGSGGWSSQDIETRNEEAAGLSLGAHNAYKTFSQQLASGFVEPFSTTPLPPLGPGAERTIYIRDNETGAFEPLATAANVSPGAKLYIPPSAESGVGESLEFDGASPNLADVVFGTPEGLTENAHLVIGESQTVRNLYEWQGGKLQLVSVMPEGESASSDSVTANLGRKDNLVRDAVSEGSDPRVVWEGNETQAPYDDGLYMRDMARQETVRLDESQDGTVNGEAPTPVFRGATPQDTRIYFTDEKALTSGSTAANKYPDLYVYEVPPGAPLSSGKLTDLTEDGSAEEKAGVENVIGYGEEGGDQLVYFVATGVLAPGAQAGAENLYVRRAQGSSWEPTGLVATLSGEDDPDWGRDGTLSTEFEHLQFMTSRVSSSGRYLAFMSNLPLTGYDNREAGTEHADEEVFLYDAQSSRLVCASCRRGANPTGLFDPGIAVDGGTDVPAFYDPSGVWGASRPGNDPWLAASLPGWLTSNGSAGTYQSRYLLNSGQLFFDSVEPLVSADVNGQVDAYEYRPEGAGEQSGEACDAATQSTTETYRQEAGGSGCVVLLSSGTSNQESVFLDASASGKDVFLLTASRLAPQDTDEAFDIYDAHACSEQIPCTSPPAGAAPPCSEEVGCRGALESSFAPTAAASAGASGEGNLPPTVSAKKAKPLTTAQKLKKALASCKRKRNKKNRRACEATARRKYHVKASAEHR
jgi:hypothetical protein